MVVSGAEPRKRNGSVPVDAVRSRLDSDKLPWSLVSSCLSTYNSTTANVSKCKTSMNRHLTVALLFLLCWVGYRRNSMELQRTMGGARGLDHQRETPLVKHAPVCHDFFTVLANVWVQNEDNCTAVFDKYRELLQVHNQRMRAMGATLSVFTTWTQETDHCSQYYKHLSHVRTVPFDPESLLLKHGFSTTQIHWMKHWQDTAPRFHHAITRLADVFRIVLAKEHQLAYTDLDLVHVLDDKRVYLDSPNVAVPVWSEEKGALEIQNSAFCFNPAQLDVLLHHTRALMDRIGESQLTRNQYLYTAFGPNLFQHAVQQLSVVGPLRFYFTHSDDHWRVEDVKRLSEQYGGFVWFHFDSSNRRRNWHHYKRQTGGVDGFSYQYLLDLYMKACTPPKVSDVLPRYILEATGGKYLR